ncbi:MAG TPA: hypothetical protein VHZ52_15695 [Acidobacteriaceae bacterium]|nr:hypothetical protein [Acidobacteriaceae bacterium]
MSTSSPLGGTPVAVSSNAASGPLLGAWWDSNHKGLRTVYGVAGAAHQGAPAFSDGPYSGGAACMRKNLALLTAQSGAVYSVALPQGQPVEVSSNGIPKASIVFSPSCTTSLMYVPGGSTALLVQGLLSTPTATSVTFPAGNTAAAVADSGSILVAVSTANGASSIQLLTSGTNSLLPVSVLAKFGGMTFLPDVDAALLADASANTVVEASHLTSSISLTPLAAAADGVSQPMAVAVSADGQLAAIANNNGASVLRLDLSGKSAPMKTICHCSPTELEPLAGNFAFRLNEPGSGTVWAFDGNNTLPRVVFIPTDQAATTQAATAQAGTRGHGGSR